MMQWMRRHLGWGVLGVVLTLLVVGAVPAHAAEPESGVIRKLGRGLGNTAFGWLEIFNQPLRAMEESGSFAGMTTGVAKGAFYFVGRTVVGVLEIITFPLPNPTVGYEPIIEPEFVTFRDTDRWD